MTKLHSAIIVISIDGPAGSGKSTVARKLAKRLGLIHLNSGALFRAVALAAIERGVDLGGDAALTALARSLDFKFRLRDSKDTQFLVEGEDLSEKLFTETVSEAASKIAVHKELREVLLLIQREQASRKSLVVEGRDSGTIVFPDADAKFFLDASLEVRAMRRYDELASKGGKFTPLTFEKEVFEKVRNEIEARDFRDRNRVIAPHVKAGDAIYIDTSQITVDEVLERICGILAERGVIY